MGTSANVLVATGLAYGAPTGTALPTTTAATLNAAFFDYGYVSDAGVVESHSSNTKPINDWSGLTIKNVLTTQTDTYKVVFLETNPNTLVAYHGPQTAVATVVEGKKQAGVRQAWIFDTADGGSKIRIVIADGQVSQVDDISYKNDEAVAYGVLITCYPDASGITFKKYANDISVS